MSEWQDISTAPKDGTTVALFNERWDVIHKGYWDWVEGPDEDGSGGADHSYTGIDGDWTDQVGAQDGTATNSPIFGLFAPENDSSVGTDVFGNAIQNPRPNAKVRNSARDTDYAEVADAASLDSLNTYASWFYYDGADQDIIDLSAGGGTVKIAATSGSLVATGLTSPTYYVGDKDTAMSNTASLGSAGWKYIAVTFTNYSPVANIHLYGIAGEDLLYDETKTLADLEVNRNATKGGY